MAPFEPAPASAWLAVEKKSRPTQPRRRQQPRKLCLALRIPRRIDSKHSMRREKDNIALSDEHNSRGIELADRGWLDEAIKEFKKAIDLDPDSAHAHDNLATVHAEKKLFREALDEDLTAIRLYPGGAPPPDTLACLLPTPPPTM